MKSIIENYNLLIGQFQKMEKDTTPDEIHDKRVILRRIFPILTAFNIKPSKIKNGEKAFKLFGKLRDIQVQIQRLESLENNEELIEYLKHLKKNELKLKLKVCKFVEKKEIKFPKIEKNKKIDIRKILGKKDKLLNILTEEIRSLINSGAIEIHTIRVNFKKFRYFIEVLRNIKNVDENKFEKIKYYQDVLGEIHDYDVLIKGIKKFYKSNELGGEVDIDILEIEHNTLEEKFENEAEQFIELCKTVIDLKNNEDLITKTMS